MSKKRAKPWKINLKLFLFLVGGVVLISLFLKTINIIQKSIFDGQNRITLVLAKDEGRGDILIFSLEPKEETISLLVIPSNINVEVPKNFGVYQLGKVYRLGKLGSPQNPGGGELLGKTSQNFIGAPVDGWIVTNSKFTLRQAQGDAEQSRSIKIPNSKFQENNLRSLVKDNLSIGSAVKFMKSGGLDTNLTFLDILRIWYQARQVKMDKIEVVNLQKLNTLEKTQLLDGTEIFEADLRELDEISSSLFNDSRARAERKTVEIVNGTTVVGLGSDVARIISNMGVQVLSVKTSPEKIKNSSIAVSGESYTLRKISKILGSPVIRKKNEEQIADILILIGED